MIAVVLLVVATGVAAPVPVRRMLSPVTMLLFVKSVEPFSGLRPEVES